MSAFALFSVAWSSSSTPFKPGGPSVCLVSPGYVSVCALIVSFVEVTGGGVSVPPVCVFLLLGGRVGNLTEFLVFRA